MASWAVQKTSQGLKFGQSCSLSSGICLYLIYSSYQRSLYELDCLIGRWKLATFVLPCLPSKPAEEGEDNRNKAMMIPYFEPAATNLSYYSGIFL
jgi:hypothetical protein